MHKYTQNCLALMKCELSEIEISERGTFRIGRITMQRKGGDGGRDSAKMLQFKINPAELFDVSD